MFQMKIFLYLCIFRVGYCDWGSEWMSPLQDELRNNNDARNIPNGEDQRSKNDDGVLKMVQVSRQFPQAQYASASIAAFDLGSVSGTNSELVTSSLRVKLENTLRSSEALAETLRAQIASVTKREHLLKDAIVRGRSGVTTVTVSTLGHVPRTYIVRDGFWTLCNGMIQYPVPGNPQATSLFNDLFSTPRCIGQEVSTMHDPCVFNSVIKYETIPTQRKLEYTEDDYLCLKHSFNNTLEQYLSVPKRVINETCKHGVVKSLSENIEQCGLRVMSEYTYYPHRSSMAAVLPLEYCTEKDGACKMMVAWHVSNASIENFEFLENELNFKKYFINSKSDYIGQII